MDQVNPEGGATPETGATVQTEAPAQDTAELKPNVAASPPADAPREPKGVGKRIDELTRLRRDAERERDHWRELAMRSQPAPARESATETRKSLKDFNYDEAAYTDHLYSEARKVAEASAKEAGIKFRAEQEAVQRRAKFDERVAQFAATVEDYHEVVTSDTPVSEGMADAIMDSEESGPLMYYLGNNRDVALKLYHMSPAKAGREIQKIEDRLVAERKKAAEKPVSKAPEPPPKVEGGDPGSVEKDPSQMTDAEFSKWFRKQRKR